MNGMSCDDCGATVRSDILSSLWMKIIMTVLLWKKLLVCSKCKMEFCNNCYICHGDKFHAVRGLPH